ncbi:MAG: hypothetical protein LKJ75_05115 [Clostridia bacterium]|jgi:hypothetical protein|nr:hypothetical protein [Clostridia bacterium]MCI2014563.1 hypothetical protein [Clostridia bacterium]
MKTQPFKLYKITTTNERYGETTEETFIDTINVAISEQHMKSYTNEIQYLVKVVTGLTAYKDFTVGGNYYISDDNYKYEIQSFIVGRWTQLQLKQVII